MDVAAGRTVAARRHLQLQLRRATHDHVKRVLVESLHCEHAGPRWRFSEESGANYQRSQWCGELLRRSSTDYRSFEKHCHDRANLAGFVQQLCDRRFFGQAAPRECGSRTTRDSRFEVDRRAEECRAGYEPGEACEDRGKQRIRSASGCHQCVEPPAFCESYSEHQQCELWAHHCNEHQSGEPHVCPECTYELLRGLATKGAKGTGFFAPSVPLCGYFLMVYSPIYPFY